MLWFSSRNLKEIVRDPLNVGFGLGFPLIVLLLLTAIQANVPVELFKLDRLTPGIAVFGLSFVALFSATLISKDRSTAFLTRLMASPLTASDFILGYTLPMLPIAAGQTLVCFLAAFVLGLKPSINYFAVAAVLLPASMLFIGTGLLCGSLLKDKQVGGVCGALLTNLTAWLSGTWFDLELAGGAFKRIADIFPFSHAVAAARAAWQGNFGAALPDLWWVIAYAIVITALAVLAFRGRMYAGK